MARPRKPRRLLAELARELKIPYTRLYNAMSEAGVDGVEDEADQKKVIVLLQQNAVPFESLITIFGPDMTLRQLSALERKFNGD